MISFLKNNYHRICSRKYYVVISVVMTMLSIILAVYLNSKLEMQGNIAVVSNTNTSHFSSKYFKFTVMKQEPHKSELVLGKYDGVIKDMGNGKYQYETIKGHEYKHMLEEIIKTPKGYVPDSKTSRGIGTNIIGYLIMFVLIQCILFMFMLAEDMEQKQIERIAAAPVSFIKYLLANFIFTFSLIFIPAIAILMVMKIFLGFNIGFGILQYVILLAILCFFGISFAMFINSIVKSSDTANMMGSSIALLTTMLSGSFYSYEKGNRILEKFIWILPQKNYLSFAQGIESNTSLYTLIPQLLYVSIIALFFFIFSVIKIKKDYVQRMD